MGDVDDRFYGSGILETPALYCTRRRDRLLALVWPPKRKRLRMMQAMVGYNAAELHAQLNRAMYETLVYGHARTKIDGKGLHPRP